MNIISSYFLINQEINDLWITSQGDYGDDFFHSNFFTMLKEGLGEEKSSGLMGSDYLGIVAKGTWCEEEYLFVVPFDNSGIVPIVEGCQNNDNCNTLFFMQSIQHDDTIVTEEEIQDALYNSTALFSEEFPNIDDPTLNIPQFPPYCPGILI